MMNLNVLTKTLNATLSCFYSMYHKTGPTDTMEKFTSTVVYISSDW